MWGVLYAVLLPHGVLLEWKYASAFQETMNRYISTVAGIGLSRDKMLSAVFHIVIIVSQPA